MNRKISLDHTDGRSYPLKNNHGKCLAVSTTGPKKTSENGAKIIQADCNPLEKGQLWKIDNNKICNDWNKCVTVPIEWENNMNYEIFQWEYIDGDHRQEWMPNPKRQVFFHLGLCLSVNVKSNEAKMDQLKGSVIWYFVWN